MFGFMNILTLYRPVGPKELQLIADSGWRTFPPRLPEQSDLLSRPQSGIRDTDRPRLECETKRFGLCDAFRGRCRFRGTLFRPDGGRLCAPGAMGSDRRAGRIQPPHRRPDRGRCQLRSARPMTVETFLTAFRDRCAQRPDI